MHHEIISAKIFIGLKSRMFSPANLSTFTVCYLVEGTYIIYVHNTCIVSSLGMGGCSIRDYLERMKQLVQFYGQVDEMYNQKAIHALKSKLSAEVRVIVRYFLLDISCTFYFPIGSGILWIC